MQRYCELLEARCCLSVSATLHEVESLSVHVGLRPEDVRLFDVDEDGDADILSIAVGQIIWLDNDGSGQFKDRREVNVPPELLDAWLEQRGLNDAVPDLIDIDGDGITDQILVADGGLNWVRGLGQGQSADPRPIGNRFQPESYDFGDIDGDGDLDILVLSSRDSSILWHRNNGSGHFTTHPIATDRIGFRPEPLLADVDADGDLDILSAFHDVIVAYENLGEGAFALHAVGEFLSKSANQFEVIHFDNDGIPDIATNRGLVFRGLGEMRFTRNQQLPSAVLGFVDWDNDGDHDLIPDDTNKLSIRLNDGQGNLSDPIILGGPIETGAFSFAARLLDLDGDNDLDIVWPESNKLVWHENKSGKFEPAIVLLSSNDASLTLRPFLSLTQLADIDGDMLLDFVDRNVQDATIWHRNAGGVFEEETQLILERVLVPIYFHDLDGDGDVDGIVAAQTDGADVELGWIENRNGVFLDFVGWSELTYRTPRDYLFDDMDGDGDLDIVVAGLLDESGTTLRWYDVIATQSFNFADFLILSQNFGKPGVGRAEGDLDGDGFVTFSDFILLSTNYSNR